MWRRRSRCFIARWWRHRRRQVSCYDARRIVLGIEAVEVLEFFLEVSETKFQSFGENLELLKFVPEGHAHGLYLLADGVGMASQGIADGIVFMKLFLDEIEAMSM